MDSNKTAVDHLSEFIASDRAEIYYGTWCDGCGNRFVTPESTRKAGEAKQLAAGIILKLNQPDAAPDAWATLVRDTPFDNFAGSVTRAEYPADTAHNNDNYIRWVVEKASQLTPNGRAISLCPFGTPPEPAQSPEQQEARRQRCHDYWVEFKRRTPELFAVKFRHHSECPLAGSQTIP